MCLAVSALNTDTQRPSVVLSPQMARLIVAVTIELVAFRKFYNIYCVG